MCVSVGVGTERVPCTYLYRTSSETAGVVLIQYW